MIKSIFFSLAFIVLSVTAGAQIEKSKSMTNAEFRLMLSENPSLTVLDVRTAEELSGPLGKIENVIHIPLHELERRISELDNYKDGEIAIICRTQNRSAAAVDILLRNGFKAKCVLGGMTEYNSKAEKE